MISTEIYIEGQRLDLVDDITTEFTYAIDDIADFGSKNTSFSKTINLTGTANNNKIFGFVFDLSNANFTTDTLPNVGYNFNASKSAQCRIFIDKIQIFKGVIRLLEIVQQGETIEYQCSVFGELGGFMSAIGNKKLEELDFSTYNTTWNYTNITNSWNTISGSGVYFPLIDCGGVSTNKIDFDFKAFKPALYVKEYLEKILTSSGYTWDFPMLSQALMQRLVIPNNKKLLTKESTEVFDADFTIGLYSSPTYIPLTITSAGSFTGTNPITYTGAAPLNINVTCRPIGQINNTFPAPPQSVSFYLKKNGSVIATQTRFVPTTNYYVNLNLDALNVNLVTGDILSVEMTSNVSQYQSFGGQLTLNSTAAVEVPINYNEVIPINNVIPKGIYQRDFFLSICKMFNLYVYDDKVDDKKIIIKPYIDFYDGTTIDWTNKIDRSKPFSIKPLSEINARYYQFKYKQDNDFYNENYRKKYNEGYGDNIYDTEFDFVKETETNEIIFAGSPLIQASGTDKRYAAIYKKSNNNTTEDAMDSVVRILQAQKLTSSSYTIKNVATILGTQTNYGYAGHLFFDTTTGYPINDINFGAPKEIYFTSTTYPTTNLFNAYYSNYMEEITDKDSKLLTCNALLNTLDILNLNFSKLIWIDGVLYRLNNVESYNPMEYTTTKVKLLKVINKTF
jgi:hypothetical protein